MPKNSIECQSRVPSRSEAARASNMRVVLALSLLSSAAAGVAQVDYFFGSK